MSIELRTSTWDDFPLVKIINARGENGYRTQADFDAHQLVFTPDRSIMAFDGKHMVGNLSLIHISEPTRPERI